MSPFMKIGEVVFLNSRPACFFLPGNGCGRALTRKTSSKTHSFVFGDAIMRSIIAPCFTQPSVRSRWISFAAMVAGLHFTDGSEGPMRRLRYRTQETLQWRNAQTGESLRVSYPSDEIVLIPISGQ